MPRIRRLWTLSIALGSVLFLQAQDNKLHHYTALVEGIDSNLKVKLLVEALMEVDPNAKTYVDDASHTRIVRIESYQDMDMALVNERIEPSHFAVKAFAHGRIPEDAFYGAFSGEPCLIETGDATIDRIRFEDAQHVWREAHPELVPIDPKP